MKKLIVIIILCALFFSSCEKRERTDQGRTEACWIYAMLACIEQEQLRKGDSVALSRQWLMAHSLEEQAIDNYLTDGARTISMRGVGPEALRLIAHYGLIPYSHERSDINNSKVTTRKLERIIPRHSDNRDADVSQLREKAKELLPRFTVAGDTQTFYYYSMRYTPQQFAESIMYDQHWQWFASVPYHPWNEKFALEVPDNHRYHEYLNIPMQELLNRVMASLRQGHPVYWEYGKDHGSDHAIAIIGLRKDKDGKPRLLCLNSYGTDWGNKGRCLVTTDFFLSHTCNVGILSSE